MGSFVMFFMSFLHHCSAFSSPRGQQESAAGREDFHHGHLPVAVRFPSVFRPQEGQFAFSTKVGSRALWFSSLEFDDLEKCVPDGNSSLDFGADLAKLQFSFPRC